MQRKYLDTLNKVQEQSNFVLSDRLMQLRILEVHILFNLDIIYFLMTLRPKNMLKVSSASFLAEGGSCFIEKCGKLWAMNHLEPTVRFKNILWSKGTMHNEKNVGVSMFYDVWWCDVPIYLDCVGLPVITKWGQSVLFYATNIH